MRQLARDMVIVYGAIAIVVMGTMLLFYLVGLIAQVGTC